VIREAPFKSSELCDLATGRPVAFFV